MDSMAPAPTPNSGARQHRLMGVKVAWKAGNFLPKTGGNFRLMTAGNFHQMTDENFRRTGARNLRTLRNCRLPRHHRRHCVRRRLRRHYGLRHPRVRRRGLRQWEWCE